MELKSSRRFGPTLPHVMIALPVLRRYSHAIYQLRSSPR
jgi:hypothetical protein